MTTQISKKTLTKSDFRVPALLIALTLVPMLGGIARLRSMSDGVALTAENARFVTAPIPIGIHIVAATVYCLLGAFQFSAGFRRRWPSWHRLAGRVLVLCGLLAGFSGLWMTLTYAIPIDMQGPITYWTRLVVGAAMIASLVLGVSSILRRNVARHEAFMIRAYAIGQGAGTQALVLGPWMLLTGNSTGLTRDLLLTLSWVINAIVAELIIRRHKTAPKKVPSRLGGGAFADAGDGVDFFAE